MAHENFYGDMVNLFNSVSSCQLIEIDNTNSLSKYNKLWRFFSHSQVKSLSSISTDSNFKEITEWLELISDIFFINSIYYVSFDHNEHYSWVKLKILSKEKFLPQFWNELKCRDFIILDSREEEVLCFLEEEYEYLAFVETIRKIF